jgi:hypothetical protein
MSWFHQLSAGNNGRPPKSSVRRTSLEVPPGGGGEPPGGVGPVGPLSLPHAIATAHDTAHTATPILENTDLRPMNDVSDETRDRSTIRRKYRAKCAGFA